MGPNDVNDADKNKKMTRTRATTSTTTTAAAAATTATNKSSAYCCTCNSLMDDDTKAWKNDVTVVYTDRSSNISSFLKIPS